MFVGGALGALLRAVLIELFPADATSATTLAINLVGSFMLAWLTAALFGRRPRLQFLFGTGFLGGFTTYSALALDVTTRLIRGDMTGLLIAVLSLAGGIALARIGWQLGRLGRRKHPPSEPPTVPGGTAVAP